ncbi:NAD(P)/FAD-dependent oxidoreductase [Herbidospora daliensis]|uniref:NAD(P)/FAD-dependent oxidoreductase n=1 Tax=Herbidospora daliensis TaxID=295585 RepID=UPI00078363DF|nr:NAD(P)/FAD-dependent oxidoreductase [Herbidospora daliensis]
MTPSSRILVVGGGNVGMYVALRLQRRLRKELKQGRVGITIADLDSYMTYQPFLPEAAAGNLEPRHVVVSLRRVLPRCRILSGRICDIDLAGRSARFAPMEGPEQVLDYDYLVFCPGSITKTLPIPGLAENGIGFKTVEEATHLRNHILGKLDTAASTDDPDVRARALTFVFVGAGYAGVEALAELEDMTADACRYFHGISRDSMRWVLVEASDHILPEVGPELGLWTTDELRKRGIDVRLNTRVKSVEHDVVVLDDGESIPCETLVWTAGVKANPLVEHLPQGDRGRVSASAELLIEGTDFAFAAGDSAAVPDLTRPGEFCPPNAQHAVRQSKRLADNLIATMRGRRRTPYRHKNAGSVASLGLHKGVANVYGVQVRGFPAWFMHRTYHLTRMPTLNRKARILMDWTLALFFKREVVALGALARPREEFEFATRSQEETANARR